jgi:DNA polymerase-1
MKKPTTTLLVDGDALAYRLAAANEEETEWAPGELTLSTSLPKVFEGVEAHLKSWQERFGGANVRVALSDTPWTFRMDVYKPYKAHRKEVRKPLGLKRVREYLIEKHNGVVLPGLEADDLMGLWMTDPRKHKDDGIIVSWDKDMRAVPGRFWVPGTDDVETRDETEANLMWMAQALSGDAADGYPGCRNVGVVRAKRIVDASIPPKDCVAPTALDAMWAAVVREYEKKGQTEEDALTNARLARILRHGDYDLKEKKVRLWTPPQSHSSSPSTVMPRVRVSPRRPGNSKRWPAPKAWPSISCRSRTRSAAPRVTSSRSIGRARKSPRT